MSFKQVINAVNATTLLGNCVICDLLADAREVKAFCCSDDATLCLELLYDKLYARFLFSSVLVLNPFMIQFPLQVYPGVHEQRG